MCLGVEINLRPFDKIEISSFDKWRLEKLITLGLTSLPSYLAPNTVAVLDGYSIEGSLCVFSKVTLSEFADTFEMFSWPSNKFPNVTK